MFLPVLLLAAAVLCVCTGIAGLVAGRGAGWFASAGLAVITLLLAWHGPSASAVSWPWLPSLGVELRLALDGVGLLFALVVTTIGSLVMAYAASYLPPGRHGLFYALLTFFPVAMLLLVSADDLVALWVAWEFTTLCSFLLIQQTGPKGKGPAIRTLIVTAGGGLCLLAAVTTIWAVTGTTALGEALTSPVWETHRTHQTIVGVLVALAAFTKAAQFPFHAWLPDAMVASTPVSAYLHAAAMVKAGIFLLIRFSPFMQHDTTWQVLLIGVGLFTALMGAVFALQRRDLKELLAYSTISQLGFLVATIGVGSAYALLGALVHVVGHALFKSALFMSVGLIDHETGTRDIRTLSGLRRSMPVTSTLLLLSAASMAGLPPLFGFVSKEAMFKGLTTVPALDAVVLGAAVLAAAGTFAYSARMVLGALPGGPMTEEPHEAPPALWLPVAVAAAAGLALGVAGPLLAPLLTRALVAVAAQDATVDLSLWHGFNTPLYMSLAAIALGALLVTARRRIDVALDRPLWPVRAVDVVEGFRSGSVTLGASVAAPTRSDAPFRHVLVPLLGFVSVLATLGLSQARGPAPSRPLDWIFLAMIVAGVILTVASRGRVALVTTVGITGFSVALVFFSLGAADVALTQMLVEILTVVMMVMLLVRLPEGFHPSSTARRTIAAVVALAVAGVGFLLACLVTAQDHASATGGWFLGNAMDLTGGGNVVNTILVDFRALDTLGELTALGMAGICVVVSLQARGLLPMPDAPAPGATTSAAHGAKDNTLTLRAADRVLVPLLLAMALWFYLRGHQQPGGGFIAALVASAALCLVYLAAHDDSVSRLRGSGTRLIGWGIGVAVATGIANLVQTGSFLQPVKTYVLGTGLSSVLIFDLGVLLTVLGLSLVALSTLGRPTESSPLRRRGRVNVANAPTKRKEV